MIKYAKRFLCLLLVAGLLCGCGRSHIKSSYIKEGIELLAGLGEGLVEGLVNAWTSDEEDDDYIDVNFSRADNELTEQANQVYEALKEKDIESIKKVFAPCIAEKYDLDKEIKKLFKKIEGNVISIGEASGWTTGYAHDAEKGYEWVDSEEWLENIKTDKGYSYCLYLDGYYSNQESEEKVGMGNLILYKGSEIFKNKLYELGDSE